MLLAAARGLRSVFQVEARYAGRDFLSKLPEAVIRAIKENRPTYSMPGMRGSIRRAGPPGPIGPFRHASFEFPRAVDVNEYIATTPSKNIWRGLLAIFGCLKNAAPRRKKFLDIGERWCCQSHR